MKKDDEGAPPVIAIEQGREAKDLDYDRVRAVLERFGAVHAIGHQVREALARAMTEAFDAGFHAKDGEPRTETALPSREKDVHWNDGIEACAAFLETRRIPPGTTVPGMYGLIEAWAERLRTHLKLTSAQQPPTERARPSRDAR